MLRYYAKTQRPLTYISSQLYADILTDKQRTVRKSDSMDIQLLAVAIPVCHYMLTDRSMEVRIQRRNVGQKWETQVFSLSTIEELIGQLEKLR
jgi:hypothetical protein